MAQWFYLIDGHESGPVESAALKQLADAGRLQPNDKVRRANMVEWHQAEAVKGLFTVRASEPLTSARAPTSTATLARSTRSSTVHDLAGPKTISANKLAPVVDGSVLPNQDQEVLTELERLQDRRPSWWGAIALLAISLLLFMGAESTDSAWDGIFIIVPVLLFHELGHYVAMRGFGYRNLRMFFIPFFGAAVSGQHYNIAGWKKAIVALAGPLPGIAIGAPLGVVGLILREPRLLQVSLLALIVNGFNLLPLLPLDGGRAVHDVLFVRHPVLDAVFRIVAALGLIAVAILMGNWILIALPIGMLFAIPAAWRLARISYRLRNEGLVAVSPDDDSIPAPAALSILAAVRSASSPKTTPKVLAQNVADVFETLNAHPPNAFASLGLLGLHAVGFATALLTAVLIRGPESHGDTVTKPTVVASMNGRYQLTIPAGWSTQTELLRDAVIQVGNPNEELYLVMISESKEDLEDGFRLEKYADIVHSQWMQTISEPNSTSPASVSVNGHTSIRYELNGTALGLKLRYVHTVIETQGDFLQIIAWTLASRYGENKSKLLEVVDSFKEASTSH